MHRLKISDLSFCEAVTEKNLEVTGGGASSSTRIQTYAFSLLKEPLLSKLVKSASEEVYSDSDVIISAEEVYSDSDIIVNEIKDSNGESGILVSSKDGKIKAGVMSSPNSSKSFSYVVVSSSSV
ncbi:MAG: hypothetical protein ACREPR_15080 [Brasilonema sp.]